MEESTIPWGTGKAGTHVSQAQVFAQGPSMSAYEGLISVYNDETFQLPPPGSLQCEDAGLQRLPTEAS